MRFRALASDYDGTLAEDARTAPETVAAIERLRASGRRFLLVTGRRLPDLRQIFPEYSLCARIVAENGALLFDPQTREERLLAPEPPDPFLRVLRERGVRFERGRCIVACDEAESNVALAVIQELGLTLRVILNKGSAMILPSGVDKASGLTAALTELGLTSGQTVAVGDAENDHVLLAAAGFGVAVADALPQLKTCADRVTQGGAGQGVVELIDAMIADDLGARTRGPR
ncbi:MAG: HAD family hydrolase [Myxococcales bacterium]